MSDYEYVKQYELQDLKEDFWNLKDEVRELSKELDKLRKEYESFRSSVNMGYDDGKR